MNNQCFSLKSLYCSSHLLNNCATLHYSLFNECFVLASFKKPIETDSGERKIVQYKTKTIAVNCALIVLTIVLRH